MKVASVVFSFVTVNNNLGIPAPKHCRKLDRIPIVFKAGFTTLLVMYVLLETP